MSKLSATCSSLTVLACAIMLLAGCGGDNGAPPTATPNAAQSQPTSAALALSTSTPADLTAGATVTPAPLAPTPSPSQGEGSAAPTPDATVAINAATADLAKRLGVSEKSIKVVSVQEHEWSDRSLGCPPLSMRPVPQVGTPGYIITLKGKGKEYIYHADQQGNLATCKVDTSGSNGDEGKGSNSGGGDPVEQQMITLAKNDLAASTAVDVSSITVKSVLAQEWRDSNLGCGKGNALQVITPGYLITLTVNGKDYEYHTNQTNRVVLCVGGQPAK